MLIVDYKTDWIKDFEKINERLSGVLDGLCIKVEHIGSTAVPGLAAKPIIDIDIIYNKVADFEIIENRLGSIEYFHNGNQGVEGRDVFKRNGGQEDAILDKLTHHLYVCRFDCAELHRHLLFRDQLRKYEVARKFYQHLKYEIAREANNDRKRYAAIKELKASSFINYIIESARIESPTLGKIDY